MDFSLQDQNPRSTRIWVETGSKMHMNLQEEYDWSILRPKSEVWHHMDGESESRGMG